MKRAANFLIIAVMVMFALTIQASPTAEKGGGNRCFQSDHMSNWLHFDSNSGAFELSNCQGFNLSGQGTITISACLMSFRFDIPTGHGDLYKGRFSIDNCGQTADGFVTDGSSGQVVFTIHDERWKNNACICSAN